MNTKLHMENSINFNDYIIDDSDYEFFNSLPKDEKILFIYSLICENFLDDDIDDMEIDDADLELPLWQKPQIFEPTTHDLDFDSFIQKFESEIDKVITSSIQFDLDTNLLFILDRVIINSPTESSLLNTVLDLILKGYIICKQKLTNKQISIFQRQPCCKVYKIIGMTSKISLN